MLRSRAARPRSFFGLPRSAGSLPLLVLCAAFARGGAGGIPGPGAVKFQRISIEQGLSQSVVTAILQDSRGFLWFGTQDGLNRYDGYRFHVYRNVPGDPGSLSANYVRCLWEDAAGTLWVGTRGGGLNRYDRRTGRFTVHRHDPRSPGGLASDVSMSIDRSSGGRFWLSTEAGLNRFDPATGAWERFRHDPARPGSLSHNATVQALEDRRGVLWVATYGGGLNRLDPGRKDFTVYRHDPARPGSLSSDLVLCVYEDRRGTLWVGTDEGGLNRFDPGTGAFTVFNHDPVAPGGLRGSVVLSLCEDRDDNFWVGTDQGLHRFDRATGRCVAFQYDPRRPDSLSNNYVTKIVQDRAGLLWVGTWSGGLNTWDRSEKRFTVWKHNPYVSGSLPDDAVNAVLRDRAGRLWVGTDAGLCRQEPSTGAWELIREPFTRPGRHVPDRVVSLLEDRDGTLWVGTWGSGLFRRDEASERFTPVGRDGPAPLNENIFTFLESRDGTLWIGTYGGGLASLDRASGRVSVFRSDPADPASLSSNLVVSLFEDRAGVLWVGTMVGGLNRLDRRSGRFTTWRQDPSDPRSLGSDTVWCIREGRTGDFWVGTGGGGLALFDRPTGRCRSFRQADGLPNDVVYGILEDAAGSLWLSTNKGLCRFDPVRRTFRTYDDADGLPSDEFNQAAFHLTPRGEMIFGGIAGLVSFRPEEIRDNPAVPPVVITGLRKFNREVDLGGEVSEMREIVLAPEDTVFSLEYAALNFTHPEKTLYAYRMEGFDRDWIPAGNARSATYTNLDPGDYVFRVRGSNDDGVWNLEGASIRVVIRPPYWKTWWFRVLAAFGVLLLTAGGFLLRIRSLKRREVALEQVVRRRTEELEAEIAERQRFEDELGRVNEMLRQSNEKLKDMDRLKTEFLNMAAHEIRTPLTAVLGFAKIVQKKFSGVVVPQVRREGDNTDRTVRLIEENLQIITQEADRLTALINDLLDVAKLEAGKVDWDFRAVDPADLVDRAMAATDSLVRLKGLAFARDVAGGLPAVRADRDRVLQVLINLLSNAVKFTEAGTITCGASREPDGVRFRVTDTGIGIAPEDRESIFEKFRQLGDTLTGKPRGTGLGLAICRQIAEHHDGRIGVESEPGRGSTFYVVLPPHPAPPPEAG